VCGIKAWLTSLYLILLILPDYTFFDLFYFIASEFIIFIFVFYFILTYENQLLLLLLQLYCNNFYFCILLYSSLLESTGFHIYFLMLFECMYILFL